MNTCILRYQMKSSSIIMISFLSDPFILYVLTGFGGEVMGSGSGSGSSSVGKSQNEYKFWF